MRRAATGLALGLAVARRLRQRPDGAPAARRPPACRAIARSPARRCTCRPARAAGARLPLVIGLHGAGGTGADFDGLRRPLGRRRRRRASPPSTRRPPRRGASGASTARRARTTSPRIEALLDAIEALGCTDPDRVYATGVSNGGGFAARLGCELADRLAGRRAGRRRLPRARPLPGEPAHVAARDPRARRPRRALPRHRRPTSRATSRASSTRWARPRRLLRPPGATHPCRGVTRLRYRGCDDGHGRRARRDRGPRPRLGRQGRARRTWTPTRRSGASSAARRRSRLTESDAKASRSEEPSCRSAETVRLSGRRASHLWPRSLQLQPSRRVGNLYAVRAAHKGRARLIPHPPGKLTRSGRWPPRRVGAVTSGRDAGPGGRTPRSSSPSSSRESRRRQQRGCPVERAVADVQVARVERIGSRDTPAVNAKRRGGSRSRSPPSGPPKRPALWAAGLSPRGLALCGYDLRVGRELIHAARDAFKSARLLDAAPSGKMRSLVRGPCRGAAQRRAVSGAERQPRALTARSISRFISRSLIDAPLVADVLAARERDLDLRVRALEVDAASGRASGPSRASCRSGARSRACAAAACAGARARGSRASPARRAGCGRCAATPRRRGRAA